MASVYTESNITFDFSNAKTIIEHDKPAPSIAGGLVHQNGVWGGVDFLIEEPSGDWIWLEVKSWDFNSIEPHRRGGQQRSFVAKMRSNKFAQKMCGKFIGTTAFLAWTEQLVLAPVRFILLFEPPRAMDAALLVTFQTKIQSKIPRKNWIHPIHTSVVTRHEWNQRFPDYPAHK